MKVSPFIAENHEVAGVLLIPWLLSSSVGCEEFVHKFSTSLFMLRVLIDSPESGKDGHRIEVFFSVLNGCIRPKAEVHDRPLPGAPNE